MTSRRPPGAAVAELLSVGMVTPIGFCAPQTAASARAGIARLTETYVHDRFAEPIVMGLVNDEELPPLVDSLEDAKLPVPRRRLLRMAGPALDEALGSAGGAPPPLFLATAETRPGAAPLLDPQFLQQLAEQSQRALDLPQSRILPGGRAAGLTALEQAISWLARSGAPCVLVGAVDSYLDPGVLGALDEEGRLRNGPVQDGFVPGEAAAFLLVGRPGAAARLGITPVAQILALGLGQEPGHIYSAQPYRGEGLAQAFSALFDGRGADQEPVRSLYASLNGESFWAKELGVARLRNSRRFAEPVQVEHPADAIGDAGAALGPVMVGLAAQGLAGGYRPGPCLVYCSADREARAAVLLSA